MEVEVEGGVIMAEVSEVKDIVFLLEEMFDEGEGILERGGVEEGGRHGKRGSVSKKAVGLVASV